jgi:hypothetical protein
MKNITKVNIERNIRQKMKRRKTNFIVHICHNNCLLKHIIEGKRKRMIKVIGRRGRRHKQLLYDFQEER